MSQGCEYEAVPVLLQHLCVNLLMVEVHGNKGGRPQPSSTSSLLSAINRSHGLYYKEPNIEFSDGSCVEFATYETTGQSNKAQ